jgi:hypothetical protein
MPISPDPIETVARWAADQPGWTDRVLAHHTRRPDGSCAGCGGYRPTRWPCLLTHIARRAREIHRERAARVVRLAPADRGRRQVGPAGQLARRPEGRRDRWAWSA